jgi:hypothetical protein
MDIEEDMTIYFLSRPDRETFVADFVSNVGDKMFLEMSPEKFKNKRVHTKATYLINILILEKMWNENYVAIAACACVIFSLEAEKASKMRYCVRPSFLAKQKYSGNDLMTDLKRDDIDLSGEFNIIYKSKNNNKIK